MVLQTLRREGPLAFWSGWSANFARLGSWNIAMVGGREGLSGGRGWPEARVLTAAGRRREL